VARARLLSLGLVALILAACSGSDDSRPPGPSEANASGDHATTATDGVDHQAWTWSRIKSPNLSPRWQAIGVWTGDLALFVGGTTTDWTGASSVGYRRTGAAYDPELGTWRRIASAPVAIAEPQPRAASGEWLAVAARQNLNGAHGWLVYDIDADRWHSFAGPPQPVWEPTLSILDDDLYVLPHYVDKNRAPVQVMDLNDGSWDALPSSTLKPTLDSRTVLATPEGVVVIGNDVKPSVERPPSQTTTNAEIWDGVAWHRFPAAHIFGGGWHWTGSRIIPTFRALAFESRRTGVLRPGALDPSTGVWDILPWLPGHPRGWEAPTAAWGPLVLSRGFVYDDRNGSSTPIGPPGRGYIQFPATVITGDQLITFGGQRTAPGQEGSLGGQVVIPTNEAWIMDLDLDNPPA